MGRGTQFCGGEHKMGQADLLAWLEEHPGWHEVKHISLPGWGVKRIQKLLLSLLKWGDVEKTDTVPAKWRYNENSR